MSARASTHPAAARASRSRRPDAEHVSRGASLGGGCHRTSILLQRAAGIPAARCASVMGPRRRGRRRARSGSRSLRSSTRAGASLDAGGTCPIVSGRADIVACVIWPQARHGFLNRAGHGPDLRTRQACSTFRAARCSMGFRASFEARGAPATGLAAGPHPSAVISDWRSGGSSWRRGRAPGRQRTSGVPAGVEAQQVGFGAGNEDLVSSHSQIAALLCSIRVHTTRVGRTARRACVVGPRPQSASAVRSAATRSSVTRVLAISAACVNDLLSSLVRGTSTPCAVTASAL